MSDEKKEKISRRDTDGDLIYQPPHEDTLYTIEELNELLSQLVGYEVPEENRSNVGTSHWIKRKALELLGYRDPEGFRTNVAKSHKPKFIHQLMDLFVQTSNNLQIWGYIPYVDAEIEADWRTDISYDFSDMRIVIVRHEDYIIQGIRIVQATELAEWDKTGTETFKWQASIPDSYRHTTGVEAGSVEPVFDTFGVDSAARAPVADRLAEISELDESVTEPLAATPPTPSLLYNNKELADRLLPLLGTTIQDKGERVRGQLFEAVVLKKLGYSSGVGKSSVDTGAFPDIRHQLIETKFQDSPTIDLGKHHPADEDLLDFGWAENAAPRDVRFVIGLADKKDDVFEITDIIITSGEEFSEFFSITEGTNSKIQMTVPNFNSITNSNINVKSDSESQSEIQEY